MTMSTTDHETEIIVDPDVPLVRIIREFDAPPEKVFRAHADPELFARWLGPRRPDHGRIEQLRLPHRRRVPLHALERDGNEARLPRLASTRCVPNELIVQTFTFEGVPDGVALEKLALEDLGDGRTRLIATSLVDTFEARDAFVASGMESGVLEGYRKLDALLAEG